MKRQSLIFMALLASSLAQTVQENDDDTIILLGNDNDDQKQPVSEAIEFYEHALNNTDNSSSLLLTPNLLISRSDEEDDYETGEPTMFGMGNPQYNHSVNTEVTSNFDNYGDEFTLSRGQEMKMLKSNCDKLQQNLDYYNPKLDTVYQKAKKNHDQIHDQFLKEAELADQEGKLHGKAFTNSAQIKELEALLTSEEGHIHTIDNQLRSLQKYTNSSNKHASSDIEALKGLGNKIIFNIMQQSDRCNQFENEIKIMNNSYKNMSIKANQDFNEETEKLKKMRGNIDRMQETIRGNKDKASNTLERLTGAQKHCQDIDHEVNEINTILNDNVRGSIKKLDSDYQTIDQSFKGFQNKYREYKDQTRGRFENVDTEIKRGQEKWAEKYSSFDSNLQNERQNTEQIKRNLEKKMRLQMDQESLDIQAAKEQFNKKFTDQETILTGYKNKFETNRNENSSKFQKIRSEMELINNDYQNRFTNQKAEIEDLKQNNKKNQQKFTGKLNNLQSQLNEQDQDCNQNLLDNYKGFSERLQTYEGKRKQDHVLLDSYKLAIEAQDNEISNMKKYQAQGRQKMSEDFNIKLTGYQKRVAELQEEVDQTTSEYTKKVKGLRGKYQQLVDTTEAENQKLSDWCGRTEQKFVESNQILHAEIEELYNVQKKGKRNREDERISTENAIKGYMNELKEEQNQNGRKLGKKFTEAIQERQDKEQDLKLGLTSMEDKMDSVIKFLCWKNGWTMQYFTDYLTEIAINPPQFCEGTNQLYNSNQKLPAKQTDLGINTYDKPSSNNDDSSDDEDEPIIMYQTLPMALNGIQSSGSTNTKNGIDLGSTEPQQPTTKSNQVSLADLEDLGLF